MMGCLLPTAAASRVLCPFEEGGRVWMAEGGKRTDSALVLHAGHCNIAKLLEYGREKYCPAEAHPLLDGRGVEMGKSDTRR